MVNIKFKYKIKDVARKYNLPESVVEEMFNSQFKFYRETVSNLPLKTIQTQEEFDELKTTFYFKYIGKMFTTWNVIKKLRAITLLKQQKLNKIKNEED